MAGRPVGGDLVDLTSVLFGIPSRDFLMTGVKHGASLAAKLPIVATHRGQDGRWRRLQPAIPLITLTPSGVFRNPLSCLFEE